MFETKKAAEKHIEEASFRDELLDLLGGQIEDPGCDFSNGKGYILVQAKNVALAITKINKALSEMYGMGMTYHSRRAYEDEYLGYVVIRLLNCTSPIVNVDGVEYQKMYGQTYYANNPELVPDFVFQKIDVI